MYKIINASTVGVNNVVTQQRGDHVQMKKKKKKTHGLMKLSLSASSRLSRGRVIPSNWVTRWLLSEEWMFEGCFCGDSLHWIGFEEFIHEIKRGVRNIAERMICWA